MYLPQYKSSCVNQMLGLYIFYSNRSSMVINLWGLDKYNSKHTGIRKNLGVNKNGRTDGKDMIRKYMRIICP